eukprot:GSMAST32.ASY1.ANO1.1155.1 assembled CDS
MSAPRGPRFNFGSASDRDSIVYGCCEPGFKHPEVGTPRTPRTAPTNLSSVETWASFMKSAKISRVIVLLTPEEYSFFETSLLSTYREHFSTVIRVAPYTEGSLEGLLRAFSDAEEAGEKVVVHCATGQGRTADALALWLHHRYNLSVSDAVEEISLHAKKIRTLRRPTVSGLLKILEPNLRPPQMGQNLLRNSHSEYGMLTSRSAYSGMTPRLPIATPLSSSDSLVSSEDTKKVDKNQFHVTLIQMGGTIDKMYPVGDGSEPNGGAKAMIGDSATARLFALLPIGFTYDVISLCRRSGTAKNEDLNRLVRICSIAESNKILVTHSEEGMVQTAQYLRQNILAAGKHGALSKKTIVFTASDADFNVGVSVGALNVLKRGVFICMNGRVFESSRCQRIEKTGFFTSIPGQKRVPSHINKSSIPSITDKGLKSPKKSTKKLQTKPPPTIPHSRG